MRPYITAIQDSEGRLIIQTRFASSIEILIEKISLAIGDELLAIREFEYEEIDAYTCATHVPTISENLVGGIGGKPAKKIARAYLLKIVDEETGSESPIVRFGESVAQCLRIFSTRCGVQSAALSGYGNQARVIAIREISDNEIEELVRNSISPNW
jgi:hypothetical protein